MIAPTSSYNFLTMIEILEEILRNNILFCFVFSFYRYSVSVKFVRYKPLG